MSRSYEYIEIVNHGESKSGKTKIWGVLNKASGDELGIIKWFGRWRQYVFFPEPGTIFSAGCLVDIASFIGSTHASDEGVFV